MSSSLFILLCFVTVISFPLTFCQRYSAKAWQDAANYLSATMNTSYSECDDFYAHTCGGLDSMEGPEMKEIAADIEYKQEQVNLKLLVAILGINDSSITNSTPPFVIALRLLFEDCMKSDNTFPSEKLRSAYNAIGRRIGYLPIFGGEGDSVWNVTGKSGLELGAEVIFAAGLMPKDGNPTLFVYPNKPKDPPPTVHILSYALLSGLSRVLPQQASNESIVKLSGDILELYEELQNVTTKEYPFIILENTVANLTSSDFAQKSSVDWNTYVNAFLPEEVKKVWLADPSEAYIHINDYRLINEIGKVVNKYPPETVFSYVFIIALANTIFGGSLEATFDMPPSSAIFERCAKFAYTTAPAAAARVLLKNEGIDPLEWRNEIWLLANNIISAFRFLFLSVDWMQHEDRVTVMERVNRLTVYPTLPEWIMDDEKILQDIPEYDRSLSLYENEFRFKKQSLLQDALDTLDGVSADPGPSFDVNARYFKETISINLAYSLPPTFNIDQPLPFKYGGLGRVIGHEVFHTFDPKVIQDDYLEVAEENDPAALNKTYFLNDKANKEFADRRNCVVDHYTNYCEQKFNSCVPANKSVDDDAADIDGLKVAYTAYKFVTQILNSTEPPIPGFENRTGDEMFFYAYARSNCAKLNDLYFRAWAKVGLDHSPAEARVDMPLAHFEKFAATFNCPLGGLYTPEKRCSLWGDLPELPAKNQSTANWDF